MSYRRRGTGGFTLVEMTVVLLIVAVVLAIAFPNLSRLFRRPSADDALHRLAGALGEARAEAIATRRSVRFTLADDRRSWRYAGHAGDAGAALLSLEGAPLPGGPAIVFFADGGSTGGRVTVSESGARRAVDVDWLAGRIAEAAE